MNEWSITALGMGTVFLALIGLSLVVSLFPLLFRRKLPKPVKDMAPLPQISSRQPSGPAARPSAALPGELLAVIAAAVSAASGLASSQFRITSVEEAGHSRGFTTPAWGHADRFNRSNSAR